MATRKRPEPAGMVEIHVKVPRQAKSMIADAVKVRQEEADKRRGAAERPVKVTDSDVVREVVGLLDGRAIDTLADVHDWLLADVRRGGLPNAGALAERLEQIAFRLNPAASAAWKKERQRAEMGGAA